MSKANFAVFTLQFHTCVVTENVVTFHRSELDVACQDPRFSPNSLVTLYFSNDGKRQDAISDVIVPSPTVPHASSHHDPVLHWDSYTNLELSDDGEFTFFPLFQKRVCFEESCAIEVNNIN